MTYQPPNVAFPNNCAVRERTRDGVSIGRCLLFLKDGICPRHGYVRAVQKHYQETGEMSEDLRND